MPLPAIASFIAAGVGMTMAAAVVWRDPRSFVHGLLAAGMLLLAAQAWFCGMLAMAVTPAQVRFWMTLVFGAAALSPGLWLGFSMSYGRVDFDASLSKWKWYLVGSSLSPAAYTLIFRKSLFASQIVLADETGRWSIPMTWQGQILQLVFLGVSVLVLFNLERTMRSSIGRIRWQIKFVVLGVGGLFALPVYVTSQSLLYRNLDTGLNTLNAMALIAACLLFGLSLYRARSLNVDVYLSTATIQNSFTIVIVGLYLVAVGAMAYVTRYMVPNRSLPFDAFIVFLSLTALAVLLLSNRLRRKLRLFVSRHFRRPMYDYRRIWMDLTHRTTSLLDAHELSTACSRMVSESLDILSVSVWLLDESQRRLTLGGSTAFSGISAAEIEKAGKSAANFIRFVREHPGCLDLDLEDLAWPGEIMRAGTESFGDSRMRYAIGLQARGELVGVMTLNSDRVGRDKTLSAEDLALLETLAAQVAASLLNLRFSERLRHAKEVETFQTVSAFFVHDLKNVASRLSLTMQNFPANFENPEFRRDALQVICASVTKIDEMCNRLAMLKHNIELNLEQSDLNTLVTRTLAEFKTNMKARIEQDLQPVPKVLLDSDQIHTVLTNLILNANEAVNGNGVIRVATIHEGGSVGFLVRDNGCGMSEEFIERSLFRPFQTTKKKGLGIGLFHSKLIVEAHRGTVEVTSSIGAGTEFRVMLPVLLS